MTEKKHKTVPVQAAPGGEVPVSPVEEITTPEAAAAEVVAAEDNEEWIYTTSRSTGEVVKVERIVAETGERCELSLDEYAALWATIQQGAEAQAAEYAASAAQGYDPYGYEEGYYQGLAAMGYTGLTPEQEAYYQGVADYAAYMGLG
jgi:hypothetical protein